MGQNNTKGWRLSNSYKELPKRFYSLAKESNFLSPKVLIYNKNLAKELGIDEEIEKLGEDEKAQIFVGNKFINHTKPISQAYAGHQFGYFTMLGDGRAMLIAEQTALDGKIYDIHLKGSGQTPYSRRGDGKAVVGAMLREYLISEAMHALKIPTTRSLAVTLTGEEVFRNKEESGAVLARVGSSHIRVGTFEFAYMGEDNDIKVLADYAIKRHYADILNDENRYQKFLQKVIESQARLIAKWQHIGFIHGVMNTDNMAISGQTIDYGPCAFMDEYDPKTVFSSIDRDGRYSYENQPLIGHWNLSRFIDALLPILSENSELAIKIATNELSQYAPKFEEAYNAGMRKKLGLLVERGDDVRLIQNLFELMHKNSADFTNTFVRLTLEIGGTDGEYLQGTQKLFSDEAFKQWHKIWIQKIKNSGKDKKEIFACMKSSNPFIIPRNHRVESVLKKASNGNLDEFKEFLDALYNPYDYNFTNKKYQELPDKPMIGYQTFCGT